MKYSAYFALLILVLMSCGIDDHHFKLDGRLLHLNQGEFFVYSPDGVLEGLDTIRIDGGRFTYEILCEKPATLMIVFPNFSEQPIFAEPGKTADVKGDASHLKELEVTGTSENELMSKFRKKISSTSPAEITKYAEQFIRDYPQSRVGRYLVKKYFLQIPNPDFSKAKKLISIMSKAQPREGSLLRLQKQLTEINLIEGTMLPNFMAYDMKGNVVTSASLRSAPLVVINIWASWNYESMNTQRQLDQLLKQNNSRLKLVGISLDASKIECKQELDRDSIKWPNICDGQMFDSKLVQQLGLSSIPDNIVLKNGRVVARGLDTQALIKKIEDLI